MYLDATTIEGGFKSPVLDAQSAFRAAMEAMARPGTVQPLHALPKPPAPLTPEAAALVLTLCDQDTPFWLDPALQAEGVVSAWISFHTGAALAATPAEAHFAFVCDPENMIGLENFAQGTQEYPDRSATLILQVKNLSSGPELALEGPGIESRQRLAPTPLPRHFACQWGQNNARYPRGIDVIFVAREGVAALPRTTRIVNQEA